MTKWVNKELGSNITPGDLDGPDPKLDEHELDWLMTYSNTFNNPHVLVRMREHRKRFEQKGIFSALYELGSELEEG